MVNGMYCNVEPYVAPLSAEERLFTESRQLREYLKTAHRRLVLLVKKQAHHRRNPLGSAMCRELDSQIYQQRLVLVRFHAELNAMVDQYNSMTDDTDCSQTSTKADWEEVMEMAKMPVDMVASRVNSVHNAYHSSSSASVASGSSTGGSQPRSADHASPISGSTASPPASTDHKPKAARFPWCQTPPIEEVVELRQRLRELEQSPLFTDSPPLHRLHRQTALLTADNHHHRTPSSLP